MTTPSSLSAASRLATRAWSIPATAPYWVLRVAAALCFIGHGAFGFITKAAWVPYFAVAGIPEAWAWRLMPWVGAVDVTVGMAVLFAPRHFALGYMAVWGLWTALLRPLSAGNYGVPFALLLLVGMSRDWRTWFRAAAPSAVPPDRDVLVGRVLQWSTVLLLAGHGALGAITGKSVFEVHYAAAGLPAGLTAMVGWFEIGLAAVVALRPAVPLLLFICLWKLATEWLFVVAGSPIWEFVERAGSYAAPLALALILLQRSENQRARVLHQQRSP
jgi:hypothetical protein